MFFALPAVIIWYSFSQKDFTFRNFIPAILIGFFSALIVCLVKEFFILSDSILTTNTFETFIKLFVKETLLPSAILIAVFLLFSKDSSEYKGAAILPLLASFYAVFIPYSGFTSAEKATAFMIFTKPLLFTALCIWLELFISKALSLFAEKKISAFIIVTVLSIAASLVPAAIQTLWYYDTLFPLHIILTSLYFIGSLVMYGYRKIHKASPSMNGNC